jgi:molybdate transport system regulatory protein
MIEKQNMSKPVLTVGARFWINSGGIPLVGRGKIELIEKIRDAGTLFKAAAELNIPYRQAWNKVQDMNKIFGFPLVTLRHGGKDHGNARVTDFGNDLVALYRRIESDLEKFLENQAEMPGFQVAAGDDRDQ